MEGIKAKKKETRGKKKYYTYQECCEASPTQTEKKNTGKEETHIHASVHGEIPKNIRYNRK